MITPMSIVKGETTREPLPYNAESQGLRGILGGDISTRGTKYILKSLSIHTPAESGAWVGAHSFLGFTPAVTLKNQGNVLRSRFEH